MPQRRSSWALFVTVTLFGAVLVGSTSSQAAVQPAKPSDFNGDGYTDLVIGAPNARTIPHTGRGAAGLAVVLYGTATGPSISKRHLLHEGFGWVPGQPTRDAGFGAGMASGDLNADGYADLAVCAPNYPDNGGALLIAFGSSSGLRSGYSLRGGGPSECSQILSADFNRDGYFDLVTTDAVSAAAIVMYGRADLREGSHRAIFGPVNDRAGRREFAVGDVNGDGFADLLTGSLVDWESRELTLGGSDGLAKVTQILPEVDRGPAAIGDLDKDGFADVAIGDPHAWRGDRGAAGQVRVWKGSASGLVTNQAPLVIAQDVPGVPDESENDDAFGGSVVVGDGNGDGYGDLAIGATENVGTIRNGGAVTVIPGSATGPNLAQARLLTQNTPGVPDTIEEDDQFDAKAFTDLNGDGRADLVVSSMYESVGPAPWERRMAGLVFLIPGSGSGVTGAGTRTVSPLDVRILPENASFGQKVAQ
jgi:hypothetical protein